MHVTVFVRSEATLVKIRSKRYYGISMVHDRISIAIHYNYMRLSTHNLLQLVGILLSLKANNR